MLLRKYLGWERFLREFGLFVLGPRGAAFVLSDKEISLGFECRGGDSIVCRQLCGGNESMIDMVGNSYFLAQGS